MCLSHLGPMACKQDFLVGEASIEKLPYGEEHFLVVNTYEFFNRLCPATGLRVGAPKGFREKKASTPQIDSFRSQNWQKGRF